MHALLICSVIVESLKVDSLQRLASTLEPMLRRIVSQIFTLRYAYQLSKIYHKENRGDRVSLSETF